MKGSSTRRHLFLVSSLALAVSAGNAFAGGYEKATLWDAKYSALAGAAASSVDDSSAIFFNPAGLAFAERNDVALHLSPTLSRVDSPAEGNDSFVKGNKKFTPSSGFTGLYKLNDKFTLGYGIYAAGGSVSEYDVTYGSSAPLTDTYSTDVKVIEGGLALAYRINNNWSVGGTYRISYAYADINMMSAVPYTPGESAGVQVSYNDMTGWDKSAVRLGAMYRSDDNRWGWGINYRSEVLVKAEGKASFKTGVPGGVGGDFSNKDAKAETALPMQISTGVDYRLNDDLTLFGEVTFSKYSTNKSIPFESDEQALVVNEIYQNWEDQYNYRIAAEYTGIAGWALRGGYIYTTAVVPDDYASPTFSTPAAAHTITFGAGTTIMDGKVELDFGADYNLVHNKDAKGGGEITNTRSRAPSGEYKSQAFALHMSTTYKF